MQKKAKLSRRTILLILSGLVSLSSVIVSIPFIVQSLNNHAYSSTIGNETNRPTIEQSTVGKPPITTIAPIISPTISPVFNGSYDNFVNNYDGTLTSSSLTFAAPNAKPKTNLIARNTFTTVDNLVGDDLMNVEDDASQQLINHGYDPKYNSIKKVVDVNGKERAIVTTNCFENNRKYMPILTYDNDTYYSYSQTRSWDDVNGNVYPGWNLIRSRWSSHNNVNLNGISLVSYSASDNLVKAYPEVTKKIIGLEIIMPTVVASFNEGTKDLLTTLINEISSISYLTFYGVDDTNVKYLPDIGNNQNIKKIAIRGTYSNLQGFAFPDSVLELEFSSQNYKSVDPLQFPINAAIIYEQGYSSYFTHIDLSSHKQMKIEDLQKAVDVVYEHRIHERAFQGNFSGGYIYSWNLRNTGIYSFNDVTIPMLTDGTGRFYIAYVEIETDGVQGPDKNEVIGGNNNSNKPSNDSQINEWYDWNENGWSKVEKVTVTAKDGKALDFNNTVQEIVGFVNKYPNIKTVDVSALKFTNNKSLDELESAVNEVLAQKYTDMSGQVTVKLTFIKTPTQA